MLQGIKVSFLRVTLMSNILSYLSVERRNIYFSGKTRALTGLIKVKGKTSTFRFIIQLLESLPAAAYSARSKKNQRWL